MAHSVCRSIEQPSDKRSEVIGCDKNAYNQNCEINTIIEGDCVQPCHVKKEHCQYPENTASPDGLP